jgi:hypothetical protein
VQKETVDFLFLCAVGEGVYSITFEHVHELQEQENQEGQEEQEKQEKLSQWDVRNTNFSFPVEFVGRDASTSGNWPSKYGKLGYVLFNYTEQAAITVPPSSSSAPAQHAAPRAQKITSADLVKLPRHVANVWAAG